MLLSFEIIKMRLERDYPVEAYGIAHTALELERPKYYYPGINIAKNRLYIVESSALPLEQWDGCFVVCSGNPCDIPSYDGFRLLVVEGAKPGEIINSVNETFDLYDKWDLALKANPKTGAEYLYAMLDASIPVFENVIRLMNTNFRFEYVSDKEIEQNLDVPHPDESGFVPLDIVNSLKSDPYYVETSEAKDPFILPSGILPFSCLCANLFADEKLIGRIVVNELRRQIHETDLALLAYLAEFVQIAYADLIQRDQPIFEMKGAISQALGGADPAAIDLTKILRKYHWARDDSYVCLKLSTDELSSPERHYVCREFEKRYKGTCGVEFDENVAIVANLSLGGQTLGTFIAQIEYFAKEGRYKVGASVVFDDIYNLRQHYTQAGIALKTGASSESASWIYHFEDFRLKYLMTKCVEGLHADFTCHAELVRLKQIDAETGTNYYKSLSLYLKNCRNAVQTAEALFIHRLTLIYRLNRIKEITALKWDAPEDYFGLLLSVYILENVKG